MATVSRYKSVCPACGEWIAVGTPMERHPQLGDVWVHKACGEKKLPPTLVARIGELRPLTVKEVREVAKGLKLTTTRDGRYMDQTEIFHKVAASGVKDSEFAAAVSLATGKPLKSEKIIIGGTDEEVAKIKKMAKPGETVKVADDYVPVPNFDYMVDAAEQGDNLFFVGPSGSGKTETALAIARRIAAELIRQNFDGDTTTDNLIGTKVIDVREGVSVTTWEDGELARACRLAASGKRVVYLCDEVQAGKPEVLFKFHRVMEIDKKTGARSIEVDGKLLVIPKGMLTIIGTGNSFRLDETGLYQGSNAMNNAFCNRWTGGVYYVDYAPNEDEILVAAGIPEKLAKMLVAMAKEIRRVAEQESSPITCSTRQMLVMGQKAVRWGYRKAIEIIYLNTLTADERKLVDPVVLSMFK